MKTRCPPYCTSCGLQAHTHTHTHTHTTFSRGSLPGGSALTAMCGSVLVHLGQPPLEAGEPPHCCCEWRGGKPVTGGDSVQGVVEEDLQETGH